MASPNAEMELLTPTSETLLNCAWGASPKADWKGVEGGGGGGTWWCRRPGNEAMHADKMLGILG